MVFIMSLISMAHGLVLEFFIVFIVEYLCLEYLFFTSGMELRMSLTN